MELPMEMKHQKYAIIANSPAEAEELSNDMPEMEGVPLAICPDARSYLVELKSSFSSAPFSFLLLSSSLTDNTCLELIKLIRKDENFNNLMVLVLYEEESSTSAERFLNAGAQDFIQAPFGPVVLKRKMESLLITLDQKINKKTFLPIRPATFQFNIGLKFNTFHFDFDRYRLFLKENEIFETKHQRLLDKFEVKKLYIEDTSEPKYQQYLDQFLDHLIAKKELSTEDKVEFLSDFSQNLIKTAHMNPSEDSIKHLSRVSQQLHKFMSKEGMENFRVILDVDKDSTTYRHSLNVAAIVLLLVEKIKELQKEKKGNNFLLTKPFEGMFTKDQGNENLKTLLDAAMLHDIGKGQEENKPGEHAIIGANKLSSFKLINPKVIEIISHHEEFCDGSGGPHKLNRNQTSLLAKILSIANFCETHGTSKKLDKEEFYELMEENETKFTLQLIKLAKIVLY